MTQLRSALRSPARQSRGTAMRWDPCVGGWRGCDRQLARVAGGGQAGDHTGARPGCPACRLASGLPSPPVMPSVARPRIGVSRTTPCRQAGSRPATSPPAACRLAARPQDGPPCRGRPDRGLLSGVPHPTSRSGPPVWSAVRSARAASPCGFRSKRPPGGGWGPGSRPRSCPWFGPMCAGFRIDPRSGRLRSKARCNERSAGSNGCAVRRSGAICPPLRSVPPCRPAMPQHRCPRPGPPPS